MAIAARNILSDYQSNFLKQLIFVFICFLRRPHLKMSRLHCFCKIVSNLTAGGDGIIYKKKSHIKKIIYKKNTIYKGSQHFKYFNSIYILICFGINKKNQSLFFQTQFLLGFRSLVILNLRL